jgi:hypothetical protein
VKYAHVSSQVPTIEYYCSLISETEKVLLFLKVSIFEVDGCASNLLTSAVHGSRNFSQPQNLEILCDFFFFDN